MCFDSINTKINSYKEYLFGFFLPENPQNTHTDQSMLQGFFYSIRKETTHKL